MGNLAGTDGFVTIAGFPSREGVPQRAGLLCYWCSLTGARRASGSDRRKRMISRKRTPRVTRCGIHKGAASAAILLVVRQVSSSHRGLHIVNNTQERDSFASAIALLQQARYFKRMRITAQGGAMDPETSSFIGQF